MSIDESEMMRFTLNVWLRLAPMIKLMRHKILPLWCCDVIYVQDARKNITAEFLCFAMVQRFIVCYSFSFSSSVKDHAALNMLSKGKKIFMSV